MYQENTLKRLMNSSNKMRRSQVNKLGKQIYFTDKELEVIEEFLDYVCGLDLFDWSEEDEKAIDKVHEKIKI